MNGEVENIERLNEARRLQQAQEPQGRPPETARTGPRARIEDYLLAAAKDGFDWVIDLLTIGEIPFVGQVPGMLFGAAVAFYRFSAGGAARPSRRRLGVIILFLIVDNLPLINNLPLTFLSTLF